MSANTIARLTAAGAPLTIENGPLPVAAADEIVVENKAVAINPVDSFISNYGFLVRKFPVILGLDSAGVVVSVGSEVANFKKGDRVFSLTESVFAPKQDKGAFQKYSAVRTLTTGKLPENVSFVEGSTLAVGAFTAGVALFHKNNLGLDLPQAGKTSPNGKTVLVWGGSSSVGSNAIQLAVAAGYKVVTTASAKNAELLRKLGAETVLDYTRASIVDDAVAALSGTDFVGTFLAAANGASFEQAAEITKSVKGEQHVASAPMLPEGFKADVKLSWVDLGVHDYSAETRRVAHQIFDQFLPQALEKKEYAVAPAPRVLGKGLEALQGALGVIAAGVSAQKLVVEL